MDRFEIVATIRRDKETPLDKDHFPEMVKRLYNQGIRRFRVNLAKFSTDYFDTVIEDIKTARNQVGNDIHFILDFPYPQKKSRICVNKNINLKTGQCIKVFSSGSVNMLNDFEIEINSDMIGKKMKVNDSVLYGDGTVCFAVDEIINNDTVIIRALNSGCIENAKALNFTGSLVCDDSIFSHIIYMLEKTHCEYLALSFIENGKQLQEIKNKLGNVVCKIISKVENNVGVENIEEICDYSDEIMLGRGDLGLFSDLSLFGLTQEKIIKTCQKKSKKILLATDFLSSMENRVFPTRAEIIDVYNAKKSGVDGIVITYGVVRSRQCSDAIEIIQNQKC